MKWLSALLIGAVIAMILPMFLGGAHGLWMDSWVSWGTIRPLRNSPGLLLSIPVLLISAVALRIFFNWHGD